MNFHSNLANLLLRNSQQDLYTEDRHSTISVEKDGCQSLKRTQLSVLFELDMMKIFLSFIYNNNMLFILLHHFC